MSASLDVKGIDELQAKLTDKLGEQAVNRRVKNVLRLTGRLSVVKLKTAVNAYRDTGATVNEVVVSDPKLTALGVRTVKVGWDGKGSKQRWRLVHLNEFGYTRDGKSYHPRGVGKIRATYDQLQPEVLALAAEELRRLLR